jgi:hypothetical protein
MIEDCFQTYCAHEHYKDKWIVSALDSDEFIAHKNTSRTEREGDHGYIPGLPANSLVDVLKRYETGTSRHSALCVTTSFNLWPFKEKPLRKIGWNEIGVGAKREDNWSRPDKLAIEHSIFMHKSKRYFAPKCIFRTKFLWGHLWQHGVYTNGSCPKRFYEIKKNKPRVNLCDSFNGRRKIPFFCKLFCSGALDHHIYPDELVLFHMRLGYGPPTGEFEPTLLNMAPDVRQRLQAMYKVDSIAKIPNHVATK